MITSDLQSSAASDVTGFAYPFCNMLVYLRLRSLAESSAKSPTTPARQKVFDNMDHRQMNGRVSNSRSVAPPRADALPSMTLGMPIAIGNGSTAVVGARIRLLLAGVLWITTPILNEALFA